MMMAWAVANLMNSTGNYKTPIKPADLIGEKPAKRIKKRTSQEEVAALQQRFGG
jgi:hypothetical protein